MIYLIIQTPPPYHGVSLMNRYLVDFLSKQSSLKIKVSSINASKNINSIGKFNFSKFFNTVNILKDILFNINKIDSIYIIFSINSFAFYRDSIIVLLAKFFKKKIILHFRVKGFSDLKGIKLFLFNYIIKDSYVIQHSDLLAYDTNQFKYKKRFFIPNGWKDVYQKYRLYQKNKEKTIDIVFFSNLMVTKGLFVTLNSILELKNVLEQYNCKIHFLGAWENKEIELEFFKFIKDNNIEKYIEHIGPLYDDDKYKFLINMDIVLFPTYYPLETWGNVILESMMFKIPVIATYEGAIPDMITDGYNGFLTKQQNNRELAEKLKILIENKEKRKEFGRLSREIFLEKFTLEVFEQNMFKCLSIIEGEN